MDIKEYKILPNFLVVGAAKCGTTSLYHYLLQHPDVYMSPIKETNHFSRDIRPENFSREYKLHEERKAFNFDSWFNSGMKERRWAWYVHDNVQYSKLFSKVKDEHAIGEISNSYLYSTEAAKNIQHEIPTAKIIMMLRNPVDRLYSHYLANIRDGKTVLPLMEEFAEDQAKKEKGWSISHVYLELGMYSEQVKRYLDNFPRDQVKIYFHDDYKKDAEGIVRDLFRFLGVDNQVKLNFAERHNEAKEPKNKYLLRVLTYLGIKKRLYRLIPSSYKKNVKSQFFKKGKVPPLSDADRKTLTEYYRADILKLQEITGRDLSSWLSSKA